MKLEAKHLSPYLPYNLQVEYRGKVTTLDALDSTGGAYIGKHRIMSFVNQRHIKPILRPLSSMSLEEIDELNSLIDDSVMVVVSYGNWVYIEGLNSDPWSGSPTLSLYGINRINEYLLSKHFDVFRLIDKGLAVEKR